MSQIKTLAKVLEVREQEKKDAQLEHHQSIEVFEHIATRLYELLKKKESAESSYERFMHETTPIDQIRDQVQFIEILNKQIIALQKKVTEARTNMEQKQLKLTDAHVEVKKYEKVIELREEKELKVARKLDQAFMDEISTQQFLSRSIGE